MRELVIILLVAIMLVWCTLASAVIAQVPGPAASDSAIDRHALVNRHNITTNKPDPLTPLSVGNGEFAFTADITGLQTFPEFHEKGMPLHTMAQWGWHSFPNPQKYKMEDVLDRTIITDARCRTCLRRIFGQEKISRERNRQ